MPEPTPSNQVCTPNADFGAGRRGPLQTLLLLPWLDHGGADQVAIDVAETLHIAGIRVTVMTTQESPNHRLAALVQDEREIWALPDLLPASAHATAILEAVERLDVGVVHIINSRLGFDLVPALSHLPRPPAIIAHLMGEEGPGRGYPRYAASLYRQDIDLFITVSEDLGRIIEGYGVRHEAIRVVRPTVDLARFQPRTDGPTTDGPLRVLMPGRLAEEKDPELAIAVMGEVVRRGGTATLTLTGDGPLRDRVDAAIQHAGVADRVHALGTVDDIATQYAAHDVVMLTSRFEASPLAVCEAMACGLPVVAPRIGGIPELLGEDAGVLVDQRTPEAFAAALMSLADPGVRAHAGQEGRRRAEALLAPIVTQAAIVDAYAGIAAVGQAA